MRASAPSSSNRPISGARVNDGHAGKVDLHAPTPHPVAACCQAVRIGQAACSFICRHSFATGLLARTGNLTIVQAALRHRSITSTMVYAKVNEASVRAALG